MYVFVVKCTFLLLNVLFLVNGILCSEMYMVLVNVTRFNKIADLHVYRAACILIVDITKSTLKSDGILRRWSTLLCAAIFDCEETKFELKCRTNCKYNLAL